MSFVTYPNLIDRFNNSVYLQVVEKHLDKNTYSVKLQGSKTLNPPVAGDMVTVLKGQDYMSSSIKQNRTNIVERSRKGCMYINIDPDDYASTTFHGEGAINFVRILELDSAGSVLKTGGWLVVPTASFVHAQQGLLAVNGTAPSVSTPTTYSGLPPVDSMSVLFPSKVERITFYNTGSNPIFIALGSGLQEVQVANGDSITFHDSGTSTIFLRAVGGTSTFTLNCVIPKG